MSEDYGPRWGRLRLDHMTEIDPSLEHQVVFITVDGGSFHATGVSCNCMRMPRQGRKDSHTPMGFAVTLDEARAIYNNPSLHRVPFTEQWRAKW